MQEFFLLIMDSPFLCQLACRLAAVIGVGCRQPDADPALDIIFRSPAWAAFYGVPAFFRPPGAASAEG